MPQPPKIHSRRAVPNSQYFKVEAAELEFSNGERREYQYLLAGELGAVIIVPMISDTEFLLIQEFGIGVNAYEWCLPKGKVDKGETLLEAANRELQEEAGYAAKELVLLKSFSQSPNYMQHKTHVVLARGLYESRLVGDEPEPLAVKKGDMSDLFDWVTRNDLTEARSIAALYFARDWMSAQASAE